MIYTARQLEDLHKTANGPLVLPYGARLTPLAADWIKAKKVSVGYSNVEPPKPPVKAINGVPTESTTGLLWWCDGPCGAAKAAIAAQSKETPLAPFEAKDLLTAIKHLAAEVKAARAHGGVLLVQTAASALLFANRCPSLRAMLGTSLETVEQGIQSVAANVLVIEYAQKTLPQIKNLLGRFARAGKRELSDEVKLQLQELSSCG